MGYLSNYKKNDIENLDGMQSLREEIVSAVQIDCLQLVSSAYKSLLTDAEYVFCPEETTITAKLCGEIEKQIQKEDWAYNIVADPFEYTEEIIEGKVSTKRAKKYDLLLENWNNKNKVKFGVEAKLLVETKYKTKHGSTLVKEYIGEAGMGKYIKKIYKQKGIMVGYVLQGSISKIISNINNKLTEYYSDKEVLAKVNDVSYPLETYLSIHHLVEESLQLYHLMLDLNSKSTIN